METAKERVQLANEILGGALQKSFPLVERLKTLLNLRDSAFRWPSEELKKEWEESGYRVSYFSDRAIRKTSKALFELADAALREIGDDDGTPWDSVLIQDLRQDMMAHYSEEREEEGRALGAMENEYNGAVLDVRTMKQIGDCVYAFYTEELCEIIFVADKLLKEGMDERHVRAGLSLNYIDRSNTLFSKKRRQEKSAL